MKTSAHEPSILKTHDGDISVRRDDSTLLNETTG